MYLSTQQGKDIHIIDDSASSYHQIGITLLNDTRGNRVDNIVNDKREGVAIVSEIYKQWLAEDKNYSWVTLTKCFRRCRLNTLAYDIEEHFGLPSPPDDEKGTISILLAQKSVGYGSSDTSLPKLRNCEAHSRV